MKTDLQERVTRNVKVLMALRGIGDQKTLAAKLGWGADRVSTSFSGRRRWALDDLNELAAVFDLKPGDLLSDPADLVNATTPVRTGASRPVNTAVIGCYPDANPRVVIPFPQVGSVRRGYHRNWRRTTRPSRRSTREVTAALNSGHSFAALEA